ncbi:MAG TPA: DUF1656 domain-containing protein [Hyphomicrobiaceae bacterium]|nr:DUF1656 domain-containing protein [Hyphomicrobiaceae bacterium]
MEISFGEVYLPPLLIVATLGLILAWITSIALNRLRWTRYFYAPTLVFVAIAAIYTVLIGQLVIPI